MTQVTRDLFDLERELVGFRGLLVAAVVQVLDLLERHAEVRARLLKLILHDRESLGCIHQRLSQNFDARLDLSVPAGELFLFFGSAFQSAHHFAQAAFAIGNHLLAALELTLQALGTFADSRFVHAQHLKLLLELTHLRFFFGNLSFLNRDLIFKTAALLDDQRKLLLDLFAFSCRTLRLFAHFL